MNDTHRLEQEASQLAIEERSTFYESDPQIPEELQTALKRAYTCLNSGPTDHAQRPETES